MGWDFDESCTDRDSETLSLCGGVIWVSLLTPSAITVSMEMLAVHPLHRTCMLWTWEVLNSERHQSCLERWSFPGAAELHSCRLWRHTTEGYPHSKWSACKQSHNKDQTIHDSWVLMSGLERQELKDLTFSHIWLLLKSRVRFSEDAGRNELTQHKRPWQNLDYQSRAGLLSSRAMGGRGGRITTNLLQETQWCALQHPWGL